MFEFDISETLRKKLEKLSKKDKILAMNYKKKVLEIINQTNDSINTYKNLKSPLQNYKRIHLTDNYLLIFKVYNKKNIILFVDIIHRDKAYKNTYSLE